MRWFLGQLLTDIFSGGRRQLFFALFQHSLHRRSLTGALLQMWNYFIIVESELLLLLLSISLSCACQITNWNILSVLHHNYLLHLFFAPIKIKKINVFPITCKWTTSDWSLSLFLINNFSSLHTRALEKRAHGAGRWRARKWSLLTWPQQKEISLGSKNARIAWLKWCSKSDFSQIIDEREYFFFPQRQETTTMFEFNREELSFA